MPKIIVLLLLVLIMLSIRATPTAQATPKLIYTYIEGGKMSIKAEHLREVIEMVLTELADKAGRPSLKSDSAVELLMLTAAQESHAGKYLKQINGPALGIFQIEPATAEDLFDNFLRYHDDLLDAQITFAQIINKYNWRSNMMGNLPYQIVLARLQYFRFAEALPSKNDIAGMAQYYKTYWNTHEGKATVEEAIENYRRYC